MRKKKTRSSKLKKGLIISFRIIVGLILIRQIFLKDWFLVLSCAVALIMFSLPEIIEKKFSIDFPDGLEILVYLFVFNAEVLGEIGRYYLLVPWWDTVLHITSGFFLTAIGFSLINVLNKNKYNYFNMAKKYVILMAVCFSMTILVFWEMVEFSSDVIFKTDMQKDTILTEINSVELNEDKVNKSINLEIKTLEVNEENWIELYGGYIDIGLYDTMIDLIVGFFGSIAFAIIGYAYLSHKDKMKIAEKFIPKYKE